eukprot:TRINITY_DN9411_c0_g1_i2.p1 TRINITY_DN9411_c0_g1~~TRINITY_DN9411_c0_g1_i2.p1  ORF type:complete len:220 (-),score=19.98 TRINITY_DN9411_c0_g1_i2:60-719(-)
MVLPIGIAIYVEWLQFEILSIASSFLGDFETALFTSYMNIFYIFQNLPLGITVTIGTRVGNAFGSRDTKTAVRYLQAGFAAIIIAIAFYCTGIYIYAESIIRLISEDELVIKEYLKNCHYVSIFLIVDGISNYYSTAMRTSGHEKFMMNAYFICYPAGTVLGILLVFVFGLSSSIWLLLGIMFGEIAFVIANTIRLLSSDFDKLCDEIATRMELSLIHI